MYYYILIKSIPIFFSFYRTRLIYEYQNGCDKTIIICRNAVFKYDLNYLIPKLIRNRTLTKKKNIN